jgi:magnesium transporter
MIRALYRTPEGKTSEIDPAALAAAIPAALAAPGGLLWVDLFAEPPESCEPLLCGTFAFHPLAVDDALQESHVPKLDDWDSYLYVVLHAVHNEGGGAGVLDTHELDLFVGQQYLVTHHEERIPALDSVWAACRKDERYLGRGSEHLLYRLVDELVAGHLPVIEAIDGEVERLEEQILAKPVPRSLEQALRAKRALLLLRRILAPQREVLNRLARDELKMIRPEYRVYFRDVYDHLVRLYGITENVRDLVAGILEMYLSALNNRMNEVMKTFTLITTLFMPISFIVGFFGMNFFAPAALPPAWTGRAAFWVVLGTLGLTPLAMYLWLRLRRWV